MGATAFSAVGGAAPGEPAGLEVVATGIPRPLQLAVDGGALVVLSPGIAGDVAGELYRVDLGRSGPVDLARQPRLRIPYPDGSPATLGSLALDPSTRDLYLGEENGRRVWRLDASGRLVLYAIGLSRLAGGSTLAFDTAGRLVIVDHADRRVTPPEEALPGLEQFRDEDYQGPLVFRLGLDPDIPLPRRLGQLAPLFPRGWGGRAGGALLPRLVAVAPLGEDLIVLTTGGELHRIGTDGRLAPHAKLPGGQYVRVNMAAAGDGTLYVSSGFWVTRLFRVSRDGTVTTLAAGLADPQGLALADGSLYLAESALHRIVRLRLR